MRIFLLAYSHTEHYTKRSDTQIENRQLTYRLYGEKGQNMTLKELYDVSPWATIFVVQRDQENKIKMQWEYKGAKLYGNRNVTRIHATSYPMYKSVLEAEIDL